MVKAYNGLSFIVKLVLQIFLGYFVSIIYRIARLLEKPELGTVIGLILSFFAVFWIVDLITIILTGKITILA
ncbi:hypothetical protein [Haploplasma modicum]|uniref:hypothetical protein n=1 Tax=Haploplasma modicum TaxID=2150 RepID=UPI00047B3F0D|nr:hypothetical protein [Haploplasma modicum]